MFSSVYLKLFPTVHNNDTDQQFRDSILLMRAYQPVLKGQSENKPWLVAFVHFHGVKILTVPGFKLSTGQP